MELRAMTKMYIFIFNYQVSIYVSITNCEWVANLFVTFLLDAVCIISPHHLMSFILNDGFGTQISIRKVSLTQYMYPRRRHHHSICGYSLFSSTTLKPSSYKCLDEMVFHLSSSIDTYQQHQIIMTNRFHCDVKIKLAQN